MTVQPELSEEQHSARQQYRGGMVTEATALTQAKAWTDEHWANALALLKAEADKKGWRVLNARPPWTPRPKGPTRRDPPHTERSTA